MGFRPKKKIDRNGVEGILRLTQIHAQKYVQYIFTYPGPSEKGAIFSQKVCYSSPSLSGLKLAAILEGAWYIYYC